MFQREPILALLYNSDPRRYNAVLQYSRSGMRAASLMRCASLFMTPFLTHCPSDFHIGAILQPDFLFPN